MDIPGFFDVIENLSGDFQDIFIEKCIDEKLKEYESLFKSNLRVLFYFICLQWQLEL